MPDFDGWGADIGPPSDETIARNLAAQMHHTPKNAQPDQISVEQYREILKRQSNTRGNERVIVDGLLFDSKAEAKRYAELVLSARSGQISDLALHPVYELQAAFTDSSGARHRAISYEADFSYQERGQLVVEDVKGHRTEVFRLKEKMFRFRYPHVDFRVLDIHAREAKRNTL